MTFQVCFECCAEADLQDFGDLWGPTFDALLKPTWNELVDFGALPLVVISFLHLFGEPFLSTFDASTWMWISSSPHLKTFLWASLPSRLSEESHLSFLFGFFSCFSRLSGTRKIHSD